MTTRLQIALGAVLLVVLPVLLLAHASPAVAGLAVVASVLAAVLADAHAPQLVLVGPSPGGPERRRPMAALRSDRVTDPVTHPRRPRAPDAA